MDQLERLPDIKERLAKYSPTEITFDEKIVNEEQKEVIEVFAAGDGKVGIQAIAFVLPNDERVREEKGWIPPEKEREIYTTFLAGFFRSMRFGVSEAHGLANLMEFNFLREKGAFLYNEESQKFRLNPGKVREAVKELAIALLVLEGDGNYENAARFIERYGKLDEVTRKTLQKLKDIPVDIEPVFDFEF